MEIKEKPLSALLTMDRTERSAWADAWRRIKAQKERANG